MMAQCLRDGPVITWWTSDYVMDQYLRDGPVFTWWTSDYVMDQWLRPKTMYIFDSDFNGVDKLNTGEDWKQHWHSLILFQYELQ